MQVATLDAAVVNYINELKTNYEQRLTELQNNYETRLKEYQYKYPEIKERYDLLVYKRFVRSAEQLLADEKQQLLFTAEPAPADTETKQEEHAEVRSFSRKKPGRKPIDPNIPREIKIVDIPESEKTCACGAKLTRIGEETNEKLHIEPPRIFVEQTVRPKYACRHCEGTEDEDKPSVRIAPPEPSIIPKGIASPGLLSTVFTQKFEMHLPYYRQEEQFERIGVTISRQDMCNWQQQVYNRLIPLFVLLKAMIKSGPVIRMDETTVQVMGEDGRADTQKSYMWPAQGGPSGKTVLWYEYHETRAAYNAKEFPEGYSGYLQTDGYEGYDAAIRDVPGIIHAGCFAHARRKFFEAAKINEQSRTAGEGIKHIRKLYDIEREFRTRYEKDNDADKFLSGRKARAGPVPDDFRTWLLKRKEEVPPSLLLGKAIHYSLGQWDKLVVYLESPYLTPDNNACENAIRPFVLGRKNWLFYKSPEGAESACGIYSLIQTAKQNGLVPSKYLTTLFEKAPYASTPGDWEKLLPWNIFTA